MLISRKTAPVFSNKKVPPEICECQSRCYSIKCFFLELQMFFLMLHFSWRRLLFPPMRGGAIKQSARLTRDCLPPAAQGPRICRYGACQKGGAQICTLFRVAICKILLRDSSRLLSTPGVEPGLSRPQRDVLTTRRCGPCIMLVK